MPGFDGNNEVDSLLASCAVRIEIDDVQNKTTTSNGSGFFVAPGLVLTCRHVVERSTDDSDVAPTGTCYWQSKGASAEAKFVAELPPSGAALDTLDLALLRLTAPYPLHDCVCLLKGLALGDDVACFGFPGGGAGDTLTFESEGFTQKPGWQALKLKKGDAREGFSGSALLNRRTKAVCAVLYSRDVKSPETARAIPIELALQLWPDIGLQAKAYHEQHPDWSNLLPLNKFVQYIRAYRERMNRVPIALHPEVVPPPLMEKWKHFMGADQWPDHIGHVLEWIESRSDVLPNGAGFREQISRVNLGQPYDPILAQIRALQPDQRIEDVKAARRQLQRQLTQLQNEQKKSRIGAESGAEEIVETRAKLKDLSELKNGFYMLSNELKAPSFQRCFLVMGGFGSGKTQFLASLINNTDDSSIVFPLTLDSAEADEPGEMAVKLLSKTTDVGWKSLAQFAGFVSEHRNQKLVIAFDDFHIALKRNPRLSRALLEAIRSNACRSLYWLVCIDEASYHLLLSAESGQQREDENRFWLEYGFTRIRPRVEEFKDLSEDGISEGEWAACGGWLSLDSVNASEKTGWKILTQLKSPSRESGFTEQGDLPDAIQPGLLNNPWIAWTMWDIKDSLGVRAPIDLNYPRFVEEFWRRYKLHIECEIDTQYLYDSIRLIAAYVSNASDNQLPLGTVIKTLILPQGTLPDDATARKAMHCLMEADLLRIQQCESDDFEPSERVDLRFPFFWGWRVAERTVKDLNSKSNFNTNRQDAFKKKLGALLAADRFGLDRDSLATYLLLMLDSTASKNPRLSVLADNSWSWLEQQRVVRATVWLTIPKSDLNRQRPMAQRLWQNTPDSGDLGIREIFALIHMVREVLPEALGYGKRFHVLRPHYGLIADSGLEDYFLLTVRDCFQEVSTTDEIVSAMIAFGGCELLRRSVQIAEACYFALRRLLGSPDAMIPVMIAYLQAVSDSESVPEQKDRYFYQFMLTKFCRELIETEGPEAFWKLRDANWYEGSNLQIRYPIDKEMKKEANFTFGFWYRTHHYPPSRKQFLNLVTELVQTGADRPHVVTKGDREAAFFLVRHTSPTLKEHSVRVDALFREVVEELEQDPGLTALNRRYSFILPEQE